MRIHASEGSHHTEDIEFYVADIGDSDLILGTDWLKKHNPNIDWEKHAISLDRCPNDCDLKNPPIVNINTQKAGKPQPVEKIAGSRRMVKHEHSHTPTLNEELRQLMEERKEAKKLPHVRYTEDEEERFQVPEEWEGRTIASILGKIPRENEETYQETPRAIRAAFTRSQQLAEE
ncbi:hypothetical protein PM082_011463 [Marasmius tenuissimus]|nr:hypothetical protein PM082_011463 [Marasmius tenuissimus]